MFIRPIGRNSLQGTSQKEYKADIVFETQAEFISYIINQPKIDFLKPSFWGFSKTKDSGFLADKNIKIEGKEYVENVIFVLDKNNEKIKETFLKDVIELTPEIVSDNIKSIRNKNTLLVNKPKP